MAIEIPSIQTQAIIVGLVCLGVLLILLVYRLHKANPPRTGTTVMSFRMVRTGKVLMALGICISVAGTASAFVIWLILGSSAHSSPWFSGAGIPVVVGTCLVAIVPIATAAILCIRAVSNRSQPKPEVVEVFYV